MKLLWWPGRTSKPAFRDRVCRVLREKLPGASLEATGELDIRISGLDGLAHINMWLGRAYQEFWDKPEQAQEIIDRYVGAILASAVPTPPDLDRVVPMLKPHDWAQRLQSETEQHAPGGFSPWVEPYNADLAIVYAEDCATSVHYCQREALTALGLTTETIRARALANLRAAIGDVSVVGADGIYLLSGGGTFDASMILLDEVMNDPRVPHTDHSVLGVSDRDSVWLADGSNPWAVFRAAVAVAAAHHDAQHPISPSLYQRSQGRWERLDPDPVDGSHPIPNLNVIDVHALRKGGGADLSLVVASPLGTDARSITRLFLKLDGYLEAINNSRYQEECGETTAANTAIVVHLHPRTDPQVWELLGTLGPWAKDRNATLRVERISPVAVT